MRRSRGKTVLVPNESSTGIRKRRFLLSQPREGKWEGVMGPSGSP